MTTSIPPTGPNTGDRPGPQITTVFPAVATLTVDEHPHLCPCLACTDALLARLARPLVPVGSLTDPALLGRSDSPTGSAPDIRRVAHSSSDGPVGAHTSPLAFGVGAAGDLQGAAGWDGPAAPAGGCQR